MLTRPCLVLALLVAVGVSALAPVPAHAATTTRVSQRYTISATLDVAAGRLDAVEELEFTNRSAAAIDHVNLSVVPRALN